MGLGINPAIAKPTPPSTIRPLDRIRAEDTPQLTHAQHSLHNTVSASVVKTVARTREGGVHGPEQTCSATRDARQWSEIPNQASREPELSLLRRETLHVREHELR
jgi:hypothetical protein